MTKNEIIEEIFRGDEYDYIIGGMLDNTNYMYIKDIKQEMMLILLEKDEELIIRLYNENTLKFYFIRILMNQVRSFNSPFYTKYKKEKKEHLIESDDWRNNIELEDFFDSSSYEEDIDILSYCNKNNILTWYETNLLSIYYKLGEYAHVDGKVTMRTIERDYGIDHVSIHYTLKDSISKIKKFIKENGVD